MSRSGLLRKVLKPRCGHLIGSLRRFLQNWDRALGIPQEKPEKTVRKHQVSEPKHFL
jgi:hypothetical protein